MLDLLFVDSEYQRKGIATAIMSRIASELKMRGYKQKLNCREQKISVIRSVAVPIFLRYTPSKRSVFLWVEKIM